MNDRGLTLIEVLVALAIVGVAAIGILPAFMSQVDANTRSEKRSMAIGVAEAELEDRRLAPPSAMPMSGQSVPKLVSAGDEAFQVITHFCERTEFCRPGSSRYLRVEVRQNGTTVYDVATIFTELR